MNRAANLYIAQVNLHGRLRAKNLEYGVDSDTGGQTQYVHSLSRHLGLHRRTWRCDVLTRQFTDAAVDQSYSLPVEQLNKRARIVRLPCGPENYLAKESLWPHIQEYIDRALTYLKNQERVPDVIHGHYADGGLVATRLAKILGVPLFFTGHSLGRVKRRRLIANGMSEQDADAKFCFADRIEAEEEALENADLVIASSRDEVEEQYALYDHYNPNKMQIIPPGCDLHELGKSELSAGIEELRRIDGQFLRDRQKPALVVVARPDRQKNTIAAVRAFGSSALKNVANLYLLIGQRPPMLSATGEVADYFSELFAAIDHYNLYGTVAFPHSNNRGLVAAVLSRAAATGGLLLAPSKHETFGLTLVEAAFFGVPVVASGVGGMKEILARCEHGLVADPSTTAFTKSVLDLLSNKTMWRQLSVRARRSSMHNYSWPSHVKENISNVELFRKSLARSARQSFKDLAGHKGRRVIVTDIDDTLTGDAASLDEFSRWVRDQSDFVFGIATGRNLAAARQILNASGVPLPSLYITSVGTRVHYGSDSPIEDLYWTRHIQAHWDADRVRECLAGVPWLTLQPLDAQTPQKVSFFADANRGTVSEHVKQVLRRNLVRARVIVTKGYLVDVLPVRASKGHALRYVSWRLGIPISQIFTAGDAGNDVDMLRGLFRGIVVANHTPELQCLRGTSRAYFSKHRFARGVMDGLIHYGLAPQSRPGSTNLQSGARNG